MKISQKIVKSCAGIASLLLVAQFLRLSISGNGAERLAMAMPAAVAHAAEPLIQAVSTSPPPLTTTHPTDMALPEKASTPTAPVAGPHAAFTTSVTAKNTPQPATVPALPAVAGKLNAPVAAAALPPAPDLNAPVQLSAKEQSLSSQAPAALKINGLPVESIVVMPDVVADHVRQILAKGKILGRNPRAFSKIGDSTMAWPPLLGDFDDRARYQLGPYTSLQPTIDHFAGSFARPSAAVKKGMHTWTEYDPSWVNSDQCLPDEGPLVCEFRLHNPSIAIIRLGANDAFQPDLFDKNMRRIVEDCLARGIVPILGTKPDRREGPENTINNLVYKIVSDYTIPLWDYDRVAATIPDKGLEPDQIHMQAGDTHDFTSPRAFQEGDPLEDLTALMVLDAAYQTQ